MPAEFQRLMDDPFYKLFRYDRYDPARYDPFYKLLFRKRFNCIRRKFFRPQKYCVENLINVRRKQLRPQMVKV